MVVCGKNLNIEHYRCFGHTLKLSVNGALECDPLIVRTRMASNGGFDSHFEAFVYGYPCVVLRRVTHFKWNFPDSFQHH
ncbi:hypothetical protein KUTeg_011804 [Tegillarca granosa]|uniref:Uncharacterized protein n=1 Tax=Tegillarca granosa TaxID=220873 RepID=A0ABQ9EXQ7_TEGGR|nr:hypothetical protein KUTeg_011804 [Tegillarca granosa]